METATIRLDDIGRRVRTPLGTTAIAKWRRLEVILKVAERCNIDCSYCYFFHSGDDSHATHPAFIEQDTVEKVAQFLARTARESEIEELQIDFHGGEPLMLKKERFEVMCQTLCAHLNFIPHFSMAMQTNAMLLDEGWVEIIGRYNISVGVSLDGPKDYNDEFRVDHKGQGTYERTLQGMQLLEQARKDGKLLSRFGLICVADSKRDARRTFNHFVDDLGQTDLNIGFPMVTHDTMNAAEVAGFKKYVCDLFDAWVERNDRRIRIRFIDQLLRALLSGAEGLATAAQERPQHTYFTISSNGEVVGQDDERVFQAAFNNGVVASGEFGLSAFYEVPAMRRYLSARQEIGKKCQSCVWGKVCAGGAAMGSNVQRYSKEKGFANESVYCETLSALLVKLTEYALAQGVPMERIAAVLVDDEGVPDATNEPAELATS